jgi:flavin reductase (DIM6/NTAB) family NADH-FMN oxidoreductase RutF
MPVDPASFRQALSQFASGVTVVTTRDGEGRPQGLTVSSFCSVSMTPPMVLVCVDRRSEAHTGFQASGIFGVSVLAEHQEELSRRFAGGVDDKFAGIELVAGRSGAALIPGALAHLECRLVFAHPGGDHTIYVGEVESLSVFPGRPLLYHASGYHRLDTGNGTGAC